MPDRMKLQPTTLNRPIKPRYKAEILGELAKYQERLQRNLIDLEKDNPVSGFCSPIPTINGNNIIITKIEFEFDTDDKKHDKLEAVKKAIQQLERTNKTAQILFRSSELMQDGAISFVKCLGYGISWLGSVVAHAFYDMPQALGVTAMATWFGIKEWRKLRKIREDNSNLMSEIKHI